MSDSKLAMIFFEVGLILTLISMVLGPFDISEWAIASAMAACVTALGGIYLAFCSWDEPDEKTNGKLEKDIDHTDSGKSE